MKIAIISPNKIHLQDMSRVLEAHSHAVTLVDGGKSRMRAVAEQDQPDLMLVDGMCCDPHELVQVEYVTTHHPKIAVILLCATQSPEFLINSMRVGVREVLPSPVTAEALQAAVSRIAAKLISAQTRGTGKILAFMPCKGGSGATFLATNLGYQLAETKSVLLMDLNLQFGDALSFVHDGPPASTLADVAHDISRLDASFLAASTVKIAANYSILAAPEDLTKAMEIKPEHIDAILSLAVTQYDFVLLDMSRSLDTLAIKALDRAHRIFPVLQAGLPSLRNASKLLAVFKSLGYPAEKIELIVNRFEKGGEISLDDIQRSLGTANLRTVPNSYKEVNASINHGDALAEVTRSNAVTRNLAEFALSLSPKQEESRSLLDRLLRRA
ncbi:MAG: AAA family ATPase [Polaromonas sp.]|nr:AAA family ATPase [Polaromonas sp.]